MISLDARNVKCAFLAIACFSACEKYFACEGIGVAK